jgi:type II secretory pathway component PulJ
MSDQERRSVNLALASFAMVLIAQTATMSWWAATLQANVSQHDERLDALQPRVELLEQDFYRRGGTR